MAGVRARDQTADGAEVFFVLSFRRAMAIKAGIGRVPG